MKKNLTVLFPYGQPVMKPIMIILSTACIILLTYINVLGQNKHIIVDDNYRCSPKVDTVDGLPVYTAVESMPSFPGGDRARIQFMNDHFNMKKKEKMEYIGARIYTTFVIDTSGNVTNVCLLKRQSPVTLNPAERESLRVLLIMPRWKPGIHEGKKVPVRLNIPFNF